MKGVQANDRRRTMMIVFLNVWFSLTCFFAAGQGERKFRNHEEIEIGGGQKVEILRCRGEGPLEECDVIYFTEKRQKGTRIWENANRLREAERAYLLNAQLRSSPGSKGRLYEKTAGNVDYLDKSVLVKESPLKESTLKELIERQKQEEQKQVVFEVSVDANADAVLQKEAKRLDSMSQARIDTSSLAIKKEVELQNSMERAAPGDNLSLFNKNISQVHTSNLDTINTVAPSSINASVKNPVNGPQLSLRAEAQRLDSISKFKKDAIGLSIEKEFHKFASTERTASDAPTAVSKNPTTIAASDEVVAQRDSTNAIETTVINPAVTSGNRMEKAATVKSTFRGIDNESNGSVPVPLSQKFDSIMEITTLSKEGKINIACSFKPPAPPVSDTDKFSEKLVKRKIYDSYRVEVTKNVTTKIGIAFMAFQAEEPFINGSRAPTEALEGRFPLVPAVGMVYPAKAVFKVCEQSPGKTTSRIMTGNFICFQNLKGEWSCVTTN